MFACVKNNLGPIPPSLTYQIEEVQIGEGIRPTRIIWGGVSPHSADALLANQVSGEDKSAFQEARDFLADVLKDGPVEARQVQKVARAAGIADPTLRRAKASAGVRSARDRFGKAGHWFWALDAQEPSKALNKNSEHLRGEMSILGDQSELEEV